MNKHSPLASFARRSLLAAAMAFVGFAGPAHAANNPMDFVGKQHNTTLDCLLKNDPYGELNPFAVIIDRCMFEAGATSAEFSKVYTPLIPNDPLAPLAEQIAPVLREFSDDQYAYLAKLEVILSTQTPEEATLSLDELESSAVRSLKRENADLAVLSGLATARHSLRFWTGGTSEGTPPVALKAKWWQVVLGDVAGGIVGGIFGAGVGAVGLGTACSAAVANMQ
jgi:hypothetical protein